jgi:DNA primase
MRAFPLFLNEGISAKVLVLPQGEDPDSFVNRCGLDEFRELLKGAIPIFDFYLDQALARMDGGIDGQIKVLGEVLPIFRGRIRGYQVFVCAEFFREDRHK